MNFTDIIQVFRQATLEETRLDVENRFECVLSNDVLTSLNPKLEEFFGAPKKPAGTKTAGDVADLASDYGGVLKNQTLYYVSKDGFSNVGLVWPWSNGKSATVKIFRLSFTSK